MTQTINGLVGRFPRKKVIEAGSIPAPLQGNLLKQGIFATRIFIPSLIFSDSTTTQSHISHSRWLLLYECTAHTNKSNNKTKALLEK